DEGDWMETLNCNRISETECDLSEELQALDRSFSADIRTEAAAYDPSADVEDFPHTYSPLFNPYKQSNISAPTFTVEAVDDRRVIVNITDPLTTNHRRGKQMSIRDVLKNDLMYKIIYHKSGSTGKRDVLSTTNVKEFMDLEAGHVYCFMVAAYVPLRPKDSRHGAWSTQLCSPPGDILQELGLGVWVGVFFILLTVIIIIVTVTVLCCRQRNRALQTTQSSRPV
ncbi:tissue factor-like, partial [Embiotoca jacksoni]|uniref:tissue factor-like n=1 Tax=Embiotoca jacksoni TaxID=100190 RepID=UPI003703EF2D